MALRVEPHHAVLRIEPELNVRPCATEAARQEGDVVDHDVALDAVVGFAAGRDPRRHVQRAVVAARISTRSPASISAISFASRITIVAERKSPSRTGRGEPVTWLTVTPR